MTHCEACGGSGFRGMQYVGDAHLCEVCGGYGRAITPFGAAVLSFLSWIQAPEKAMSEEGLKKQNARVILEMETKKRERELLEEAHAKMRQALSENKAKAEQEIFAELREAEAKLKEDLKAKLAVLDK